MKFLRGTRSPISQSSARLFNSRVASGLALGASCALLAQLLFALGWLDGIERGTLDALFWTRGQQSGAPQIVLVVADDKSVARYNAWPLPRGVYAKLVDVLHRDRARTIAFDFLFSEAAARPTEDKAFIAACRRAGNVVQSCAFHVEGSYNPVLPVSASASGLRLAPRFSLQDKASNAASTPIPSAVWTSAALPALQKCAPLLGHLNIHPRADGTLRRIPHAIRYRDGIYPSLALAAAAHFLKVPAHSIQVHDDAIRIAGRSLPLDERGETGINWAGGNGVFPSYSVTQVLDGQVPAEIFQNKIVIVGATAAGSFEYRSTPFSGVQPAVQVQANALDNILLNRPLVFATDSLRFLLMLVFAALTAAFLAPRLGLRGAFGFLCASAVLWLLALWLLANRHFYLPVAPALLAGALAYSVAVALNYRREWEENFRADAAVSALARGGALMASGRDRTQLHDVIQAAARDALDARAVYLLPAKSGDEVSNQLAVLLGARRHAALFPAPKTKGAEKKFAPDHELAQLLELFSAREDRGPRAASTPRVVVAAGLPQSTRAPHEGAVLPARGGALVAIGTQKNRAFNARDAALLETLAEQAALAFENLEYYELLRGRIELANRDLLQAYEVLSEQSAKFMAAVESIDDALVLCDADGHAIFINPGAASTLREATPQLGQCVPLLLREHSLQQIAALFDCLLFQDFKACDEMPGEPLDEYSPLHGARCDVTWQDGEGEETTRVLTAQLTPLSAQNGKPIGAMLLVADVTAQRRLDQMKTDFVSFVAHELRSPLGAILGYASLLQEYSNAEPAMREEMADAIVRQCRRLNRLIGDLLDISRLESGRPLDLRRERVELRGLAEKVLDAQRAALTNTKISLRLESSAPAISAWGDPDRLEQVLVNLVSNAVKYSPDGGEVLVSLDDEDDEISIRVRDHGIGIPSEQLQNLFQKYYRSPQARSLGIKGTGLGLFLVKSLVEAHGGSIEAQSEVGRGTTFCVRFSAGVGAMSTPLAPPDTNSLQLEDAPQFR